MHYPVIIHKDPDSDYGVTVPDLPGCFTAGDTGDDAIVQATEAIECHINGLVLDTKTIPTPRSIKFHEKNPDYVKWTPCRGQNIVKISKIFELD